MTVRNFVEKTQKDYIRAVKNLAIFLGRSPDTSTAEDLRRFQLHLTKNRVGAPTINFTVTALRFFFTVTLDRADAIKHLTFVPGIAQLQRSYDPIRLPPEPPPLQRRRGRDSRPRPGGARSAHRGRCTKERTQHLRSYLADPSFN